MNKKPILVSGIQPSGRLHLGNYLGALKNFVELQNSNKYKCYFFIADLHSLTEKFTAEEKRKQIFELATDFLAAGLDPKKSTIFLQSQIPSHSELMWIFSAISSIGEIEGMTQFKDKAKIFNIDINWLKNEAGFNKQITQSELIEKLREENSSNFLDKKTVIDILTANDTKKEKANVGLLTYPVLMAADILIYDADLVPVGEDQRQHLELTRSIARKFNKKFGETFKEPQALYTKTPRIMSLSDPTKKMSKSIPESCLFLDESEESILKKVKRAVTDSGKEIIYNKTEKPAISNLMEIYSAMSGLNFEEIQTKFKDSSYSEFKAEVGKTVSNNLSEFRNHKALIKLSDCSDVISILKQGSEKAAIISNEKIQKVKEKIGLLI